MKKIILAKIAIILGVIMAIVILSCTSCTKKPTPNIVEANIQGVGVVWNYAYGYESKIYAIKDESTLILNLKAKRLYYIQDINVYTDTMVKMEMQLMKGYYNGFVSGSNGDNIKVINIKNEKP